MYKHSGQTLPISGFCSKFLSAHVKQLSKRETLSPGRKIYDPEYSARERTETDPAFETKR